MYILSLKYYSTVLSSVSSIKVILPCLPYLLSQNFWFSFGSPRYQLPFNEIFFYPKKSSPYPEALFAQMLPLYENLLGQMILPWPLAFPSTIYPSQQNLSGVKITPLPVLFSPFFQVPYIYYFRVFNQMPETDSSFFIVSKNTLQSGDAKAWQ